ncbi:alpha/beta fold hydrolase [Sphingomonas sp. SUN019]|uniref:alpha/beta fold hydrolase n=1 Tax=Sphingomonas sp. SUN019 TaxID=2937788 RepID=UPI002164BAEA|nr:alpha/beta fold hydrolase [Sphingomonas sp. SUN019]UVO49685.1 alpha/beta fold hydrolase [Sphingomonas sp. SUN019]
MDVLSDILSSMRLSGGVVIDAELSGPSCLVSQFTKEHYASFFAEPAHVIAYHYVRSGRIWVEVPGETAAIAETGCIILLPRNDKHLIYSEPGLPPVESETLIEPGLNGEPARIRIDGAGDQTSLYCGFLGSTSPENELLHSLPSVMLIQARDGASDEWLESSLRFAAGRAPPSVVARLTELLFAEAVRRYIDSLPEGQGGWLNGLRDPAVAKALSIIHSRYAEDLDVTGLAREVGMSRSAFADRFTALIGESPMRYCARWRMRMAGNLLRDGRQSSSNVAYEVGFNSEAAFTRAFKREYGEPPATWRRRVAKANGADALDEPTNLLAKAKAGERTGICVSADGTHIAWSAMGEGFPLLQPAVWFHQIDDDWDSVAWGHWTTEAVRHRRLIRSDLRGVGRSEREPPRWTFDALLDDFAAVVEASGVDRFDILGVSHGALVALAYAARHPERVRKLVLYGGYAAGFEVRGDPEEIKRRKSLLNMGRIYRDGDRTVFGQMLGALYWPGARGAMIDWFNQRLGTIMGLNESLQDVFRSLDLRAELGRITAETLVAHSRGDRIIPHSCAEEVATLVRGARLHLLNSENHVILAQEAAWPVFARELQTTFSPE